MTAINGVLELLKVCREITRSLRRSREPTLGWNNVIEALEWTRSRAGGGPGNGETDRSDSQGRGDTAGEAAAAAEEGIEPEFLAFVNEIGEWQRQVAELLPEDIAMQHDAWAKADINTIKKDYERTVEEEKKAEEEEEAKEPGQPMPGNPIKPVSRPEDAPSVEASVAAMLLRCSNFLSAGSLRVQICGLQTIDVGLRIFASHEMKLLPLVAKVWPAVRAQARSSSTPVACAALECVATVSILCADFVRTRFAKELWPALMRLLRYTEELALREAPATMQRRQRNQQRARPQKRGRAALKNKATLADLSKLVSGASDDEDDNSRGDRPGEDSGGIAAARPVAGRLAGVAVSGQAYMYLRSVLGTLGVLADRGMLSSEHVAEIVPCCCSLLAAFDAAGVTAGVGGRRADRSTRKFIELRDLIVDVMSRMALLDADTTWITVACAFGWGSSAAAEAAPIADVPGLGSIQITAGISGGLAGGEAVSQLLLK